MILTLFYLYQTPLYWGHSAHWLNDNNKNSPELIKVWGDIALFSGRFDQVTGDHAHPDYVASTGDLNLYFHPHFNRWVVSNQIAYGKDTEIRAFGDGSGACPEQQNWRVWNGQSFEQPDLVEPWSPYVAAERMFECRPDSFQVSILLCLYKLFCISLVIINVILGGRPYFVVEKQNLYNDESLNKILPSSGETCRTGFR